MNFAGVRQAHALAAFQSQASVATTGSTVRLRAACFFGEPWGDRIRKKRLFRIEIVTRVFWFRLALGYASARGVWVGLRVHGFPVCVFCWCVGGSWDDSYARSASARRVLNPRSTLQTPPTQAAFQSSCSWLARSLPLPMSAAPPPAPATPAAAAHPQPRPARRADESNTPSLSHFVIFNPTLAVKQQQQQPGSIPDPASPDLEDDLREASQIVFYTSREAGGVSRDRMLRQVGLAKGLLAFAECVEGDSETDPVGRSSH